jgi:cell wall-associated NlpC family hydrolase
MYICQNYLIKYKSDEYGNGIISEKMRIKQLAVVLVASAFVVSCGLPKCFCQKKSGSKTVSRPENLRKLDSRFDGKVARSINDVLKDAEKYLGTPYKFGEIHHPASTVPDLP